MWQIVWHFMIWQAEFAHGKREPPIEYRHSLIRSHSLQNQQSTQNFYDPLPCFLLPFLNQLSAVIHLHWKYLNSKGPKKKKYTVSRFLHTDPKWPLDYGCEVSFCDFLDNKIRNHFFCFSTTICKWDFDFNAFRTLQHKIGHSGSCENPKMIFPT